MNKIFMPKATALWLIDNTTLTFQQIADFCQLHLLQVEMLANETAPIQPLDPIASGQLTKQEVQRCEADPKANLTVCSLERKESRKQKAYVPLAKRKEIPNAVLWILKHHPQISDVAISRLLATTKDTVKKIREGLYWDHKNLFPKDPVLLGLCSQDALDGIMTS